MEDRIEPSTYDVIVLGTGLPESVLAASIAARGKSVLHLDCTGFYGAHWTSLSLPQISSFASSSSGHLPCPEYFPHHQILNPRMPSAPDDSVDSNGNSGFQQVQQQVPDGGSVADPGSFSPPTRSFGNGAVADGALEGLVEDELEVLEMGEQPPLYSSVRVWSSEGASLGPANRFYLDLAGPKLAFCAGPLIDSLLRLQAEHHVKFTAVESSYIWRDHVLAAVPASRAEIFQDRSLSLPDKRFLMRFFKLVTDYAESPNGTVAELSASDLERPFVEILQRQNLPPYIRDIILYAIALADQDQEQASDARRVLRAKEGFATLALYLASASRFPTAPGPFLYPMYGQGDLTQAFCRCAAVCGALQILRMQVSGFLIDKETKDYKGIETASGQHLYSEKLITGPSFCLRSVSSTSTEDRDNGEETAHHSFSESTSTTTDSANKVARCICITDQSLQPGVSTLLVIFPPRCLHIRIALVVRALQLGSRSEICPDGK
jgi:RAB protein geranylgeranyltransferase component A